MFWIGWEWVDLFSYTPLKKQVKVIDTGVNWCNLAEKYKKIDNEILWKIERYNANISSIDDNYQFLLVKQI
jgi:hypothetical protein